MVHLGETFDAHGNRGQSIQTTGGVQKPVEPHQTLLIVT
jgi:hypothetical protein